MRELRESQGPTSTVGEVAVHREREKVAVFVDGENITKKCRIDVKALRELLVGSRELTTAIWRDSYRDQADYERKANFYRAVGYSFQVKPVLLKTNGDGLSKSRLDPYLITDIFERLLQEELGEQPRTDVWVLASGDSDFQPVLELLKARGRKVEVAFIDGLSCELQQIADKLIDLNQHHEEIGMKVLATAQPSRAVSTTRHQAEQAPAKHLQTKTPAPASCQPQLPISIQIQIQLAPSHSGT
jgi:uncharacterized LabA/DUF88 family protein